MSPKSSRVVALVTVLSLSTIAIPAAQPARPVTVGDFAVKVARALGFAGEDPEKAGEQLRFAGVHLDADLSVPLTEGRAADVMRDLGLEAQVSGDPANLMSSMRADQAATAVALGAAAVPDRFTTDSDQLPTVCMNVVDRMTCNQCCLGILLPVTRYPIRAIVICAVLCARVFPPNPSASLPQQ